MLAVPQEAHDQSGHWAKTGTLTSPRNRCYWPDQAQDVERYIAGCLEYARHGPATKPQLLSPVLVTYPFQLIGVDFIGPFKKTRSGNTHILNLICYMSRFSVPFARGSANVEDVIWCLQLFFAIYRTPYTIYCDPGQHFDSDELREFLRLHGVAIDYSPSGACKGTGMVEILNKLVEDVLRNDSTDRE